jgi:hypothetical protein
MVNEEGFGPAKSEMLNSKIACKMETDRVLAAIAQMGGEWSFSS